MSQGCRMRVVAVAMLAWAAPLSAQGTPILSIEREDGSVQSVSVSLDLGYASVPAATLVDLGWSVSEDGSTVSFQAPAGPIINLNVSTPFFTWDGVLLQLSHAPYRSRGEVQVPLQLLADFFPRRFPDRYAFDGSTLTLQAGPPPRVQEAEGEDAAGPIAGSGGPVLAANPVPRDSLPAQGATPASRTEVAAVLPPAEVEAPAPPAPSELQAPSRYDGTRVVIIDAGHGGRDPGSIGVSGIREKTVALGISLALEEALADEPGLEVHLLRDDDTFIELWERGPLANEIRGDRPGVFISIHANSFPTRRSATGFETYFLSEARTDHERRVAALENAPLDVGSAPEATEDLDFILRELRNLDHQHWSALLAANIQEEVEVVHPGPNRGVKQGVLAVITNTLMPSVLVEIGYLSNEQEERLLARDYFQLDAAEAIAKAVVRFFERYPPGSGTGGGEDGSGR